MHSLVFIVLKNDLAGHTRQICQFYNLFVFYFSGRMASGRSNANVAKGLNICMPIVSVVTAGIVCIYFFAIVGVFSRSYTGYYDSYDSGSSYNSYSDLWNCAFHLWERFLIFFCLLGPSILTYYYIFSRIPLTLQQQAVQKL